MINYRIFIIISLFHLLISCDGGSGNIQGEIKLNLIEHIEGKDLGGTTVKIKGRNETAATDKDGKFALKNIEAGNYTLTISRDDWDTKEAEVKVEGGNIAELNETLDYSFGIIKGYIKLVDYNGEMAAITLISELEGYESINLQAANQFKFSKLIKGGYRIDVKYGSVEAFFRKKIEKNKMYEEYMEDIEWYKDNDGDGLMNNEDFIIEVWDKINTEKFGVLLKSPKVKIVLPEIIQSANVMLTNGKLFLNGDEANEPYIVKNGDEFEVGLTSTDRYYEDVISDINVQYGENYQVVGQFAIQTIPNSEQLYSSIDDSGREEDFNFININSSEAIVKDALTGLMWQNRIAKSRYGWINAINYCVNLEYGGFSDWYLPTIHEIASLVDYNRDGIKLYFGFFPYMNDSDFWSSQNLMNNPSLAWSVDFNNGFIYEENSVESFKNVVCVRREKELEKITDRFLKQTANDGKKIVFDKVTKIYWTYDYAVSSTNNFSKVIDYCEQLNYAGHDDWTLPGVNDLRSLIDYRKTAPATAFPWITEDSEANLKNAFLTNYITEGSTEPYAVFTDIGVVRSVNISDSQTHLVRCIRK